MVKLVNNNDIHKLEELINLRVPSLNTSNKAALAGSLVTLTIIVISALIVGTRYDEPLNLIQSAYPTTRFLAASVITATATILALMLAILGMSQSSKQFSATVYARISKLAFVDTMTFIGGVVFLGLHNLPISETGLVLTDGSILRAYYGMLGIAGILSGALVYIAIMLYFTIKDIIQFKYQESVKK